MPIRAAHPDDLDAIVAVTAAAGGDVERPVDRHVRTLQYVQRTGELLVAVDAGRIVGAAGVIDLPHTSFVSDLFVDPDQHGRGIGGALLDRLLAERPVRATCSSSHPAALAAYATRGMMPRWRLRYRRGLVTSDRAWDVPAATVADLAEAIDDDAVSRPDLLAHLIDVGGVAWRLADGGTAVVRVEPDGTHHVLFAVTGGDHGGAIASLFAALPDDAPVLVHVAEWSPADPLLASLGFTEVDADTWCSTIDDPLGGCSAGGVGLHPGLGV
ncbi:MAG: GNAT family N-acetyltransferase [Acidimicrobiales bacterium]